ncbi:MAG: MFS transporter, partial [Alphaproteobacteria bacterium]|nr:MFS transporter [Alphaproteobacteria bacterium]
MSSSETTSSSGTWRTPAVVITAGCLIAIFGFGVRAVFGFFQEPLIEAKGWSHETFSLAMAIQNLFWGLGLPIAGYVADRFGPTRVLGLGAVIYFIGIWGMATSDGAMSLHIFGGVLAGIGVSFTSFSIAMAA